MSTNDLYDDYFAIDKRKDKCFTLWHEKVGSVHVSVLLLIRSIGVCVCVCLKK